MRNLVEHLDMSVLDELKDIMDDEFEFLLQTFIKDSAMHLEHIDQFAQQKDSDELRRSAHSLKGSSVNVGATQLHDLCAELEKAASDELWTQTSDQIEQIQREYMAVVECLTELLPGHNRSE
ncbi:Hpt domain-containing protein [Gynuella sunshinyii]|nr:Hpt domain-containing protein [Gynuella sunshinyii]